MDLTGFLDGAALAHCAEAAEPMVRRLLAELSKLVPVEVSWEPVGAPCGAARGCGFVVVGRLWPAVKEGGTPVRTFRGFYVEAPKAYAAYMLGTDADGDFAPADGRDAKLAPSSAPSLAAETYRFSVTDEVLARMDALAADAVRLVAEGEEVSDAVLEVLAGFVGDRVTALCRGSRELLVKKVAEYGDLPAAEGGAV